MSYFIILLSLLFAFQSADPDPSTLNISASATVEVPADIIYFNINLNAESDSPQAAYDLHKEREQVLVELMKEYNIEEEDLTFQPISINKTNVNSRINQREVRYQTRQQVSIRFEDFDIYETIQIGLIENDFDNFNGRFSSTKAEEGKDEAIRKAIQSAKEKADVIAEESGVALGKINQLSYSHRQVQPYAADVMSARVESSQPGLLEYAQTVTIEATISMEFLIES